ncbi:zf-CCHC domain-containing protein [Tanacetum coccineum]
MDSENYKEGQSMQRPPLFEANCFIYWKNRFETYVKSKDIDLWYIIAYGNYKPTIKDKDGKDIVIPYENFDENHKKMISKNDEAKMVLYNALPKKEYERIFMCDTSQNIWDSLITTHQDCAFSRLNTIITSLKALDESFSSRNHVRKFLRALHSKWCPKAKEDKKEDRRCFKCGDPNHFISDCLKNSFNDQKAFVVGCWSDSGDDKEEICLMAHENEDYLTKFDPKSTEGVFLGYSPNSKAYIVLNKETMKVEESLNVKFDETPPPKSSPLVDDDNLENDIIENQDKNLEIKENEPSNKEISNIKSSKDPS